MPFVFYTAYGKCYKIIFSLASAINKSTINFCHYLKPAEKKGGRELNIIRKSQ
jgi:hypothetical protein